MLKMTLQEIAKATRAEIWHQQATAFRDIVTDTRKITDGALFVALKGERFNGESFAADAIAKGAAGVVVSHSCDMKPLADVTGTVLLVDDTQKAYQDIAHCWRQRFAVPVVAITGSNGKTTTKDLTAAVLSARGSVLKTQANFNNEIGLPLTLLNLQPEHIAAVVEIGMRGLHQIEALAPVAAPNIGIVTNVGETHMELLGSLENIARAKGELVEAIPAGGTVILNADNKYVAVMAEKAADGVRVITFGMEKTADVMASQISTQGNQTIFMVSYKGETTEMAIPMVGRHNVYNALAAIACGFAMGYSAAEVAIGLQSLEATKMRFECKQMGAYQIINDAYNASPMSMTAAISTVAELAKGRRVAVLGDMLELGDIAVEAHARVGRELARAGFALVITQGEMSQHIADAAEKGGVPQVFRCDSHKAAAELLKKELQAGDMVLFKGSRGMQMEKIIDML